MDLKLSKDFQGYFVRGDICASLFTLCATKHWQSFFSFYTSGCFLTINFFILLSNLSRLLRYYFISPISQVAGFSLIFFVDWSMFTEHCYKSFFGNIPHYIDIFQLIQILLVGWKNILDHRFLVKFLSISALDSNRFKFFMIDFADPFNHVVITDGSWNNFIQLYY